MPARPIAGAIHITKRSDHPEVYIVTFTPHDKVPMRECVCETLAELGQMLAMIHIAQDTATTAVREAYYERKADIENVALSEEQFWQLGLPS